VDESDLLKCKCKGIEKFPLHKSIKRAKKSLSNSEKMQKKIKSLVTYLQWMQWMRVAFLNVNAGV